MSTIDADKTPIMEPNSDGGGEQAAPREGVGPNEKRKTAIPADRAHGTPGGSLGSLNETDPGLDDARDSEKGAPMERESS